MSSTYFYAPNGGWGWVVTACGLLLLAHTNGLMFSLGVMYVSWLQEFGQTRSFTSWILSIGFAVMFGFGPLAASMAHRIGFRGTVFIGGILTGSGCIISYFATSVNQLLFTIGIVAGSGCCCCYLSAIAVVSAYFTTRLSIAIGLTCAGTGLGAFAVAPLLDYLIEMYGWRGALLITGALSFNICVYSLLLRPLPVREKHDNSEEKINCNVINGNPDASFHENGDIEISVQEIHAGELLEISQFALQANDEFITYVAQPVNEHSESTGLIKNDELISQKDESEIVSKNGNSKSNEVIPRNKHLDISERKVGRFKGSVDANLNNPQKTTKPALFLYSSNRELRKTASRETIGSRESFSNSVRKNFLSEDVIFANSVKNINSMSLVASIKHLIQDANNKRNSLQFIPSEDDKRTICDDSDDNHNDSSGDDVSNIISPLKQQLSNGNSCISVTHADIEECKETKNKHLFSSTLTHYRDILADLLHRNAVVLRDRTFVLYGMSNLVANLAYATPIIYIVDRAIEQGLDKTTGAMLISINGIGSIIGRIFFGAVTHRLFPDRLMSYIFVLVVAGISTMLSPLCASSFILHAIYAFVIGSMIGGYATLCAVVTIDLMGAEKGTEAYGLLIGFMGVTCLTGPPIGGLLFDATKTYEVTYIVFGFFLLLSALMMLPTAIYRRWKGIARTV